MPAKGGYHILDFSGTSFRAGTPTPIAGIHSLIKSMTDKPIIVGGLRVGSGVVVPSQFINPDFNSSSIVFKVGNHTVSVSSNDLVVVS